MIVRLNARKKFTTLAEDTSIIPRRLTTARNPVTENPIPSYIIHRCLHAHETQTGNQGAIHISVLLGYISMYHMCAVPEKARRRY